MHNADNDNGSDEVTSDDSHGFSHVFAPLKGARFYWLVVFSAFDAGRTTRYS